LGRWKVEVRDGKVYVTDRLPERPRPKRSGAQPGRVVIIGGGAAGGAAANTLRREGFGGAITMISADADAPYDRPNCSKDYLAGHAPAEWMPLWGDDYYRDQGIDLRLNTRAAAIDPRGRAVTLEGGATVGYDALLLATGADPVRLPISGASLPHVFTLRTLSDSKRIIGAVEGKASAVVIGASFIGLEVAWSLIERKLDVHVVAPERTPMERTLGPEFGSFLKRLHESHGVRFHLGLTPVAVGPDSVTLSDGSALRADVVVMGVGVRPSTALAASAGLTTDDGVIVDEFLQAAPGIWVAGDIANWPDSRLGGRLRTEHWAVAQRQGQAAARNILGNRVRFDAVPFFWSAHYDVRIAYVGHARTWDRVVIDGDPGKSDFRVDYFSRGKKLAVATVGRDLESLRAEAELEAMTV
jgi:NADPH-dependent 2,4-dienoyl-CoA reductase/sulfur reductase-like enzyme